MAFSKAPRKSNELYDRLMSIPWGLALTVLNGKPTIEGVKTTQNASLFELYKKISVRKSSKYTALYPNKLGASIKITLKNKKILRGESALVYGDMSSSTCYTPTGGSLKPLTETDMANRFLALTTPALGKSRARTLLRKFNPHNSELMQGP